MFFALTKQSHGLQKKGFNCKCVSPAGVPVSSRVSAKIQQLVNTLKRPKRPPLREFFVDDFEELLEGNSLPFIPPKYI